MLARLHALAFAPQAFAEVKLGACSLKGVRRGVVIPERRREVRNEVGVRRDECQRSFGPGECEWLAFGRCGGVIPAGGVAGLALAAEADERLDDVRRRREVR